jgi:hypothetical protein
MARDLRAPTIMQSASQIASLVGAQTERYSIPLDIPALYKWVIGDVSTADGITVLTHQGGIVGRWKRVRLNVKGADLTDANESIGVGGNFLRFLPAATPLTVNRTKTLVTTNAEAGDEINVTRLGLGNFTMAIVNGGPAAGTLFTLPANEAWWCKAYFDGTNWLAHSAGKLP